MSHTGSNNATRHTANRDLIETQRSQTNLPKNGRLIVIVGNANRCGYHYTWMLGCMLDMLPRLMGQCGRFRKKRWHIYVIYEQGFVF